MTKTDKSKKPKRRTKPTGKNKRRQLSKRPPLTPEQVDKLLAKRVLNNDGSPGIPLQEAIDELHLATTRAYMIRVLCDKYKVSPSTIDRGIAKIKDETAEFFKLGKEGRLTYYKQFLDKIARKSYSKEKYHAARQAVMDQAKLAGDTAPDVLLVGDLNEDPEKLKAQAEHFKKLAEDAEARSS